MAKKTQNIAIFKQIIKDLADENTHFADEGEQSAEFSGWIDTGSYLFNALISGTLFGGFPNNKTTAFAGAEATGKTFFVLLLVKKYLDDNPDAAIFYYDTEAAVTRQMLIERGIDPKRVIVVEPTTVQEFRTHVVKVLENYEKVEAADRPHMMMVLDSMGALSTSKEVADITEGKDTRDMTRTQLLRGCFRVISLKLAKLKVPMLITNHTYDVIGAYVPTKEMSGGGGLKYAASQIIYLTKKKDKDADKEVIGVIITCLTKKSRFTKENRKAEVQLSYETGLNRYYGLLEVAEAAGYIKKDGHRYVFPGGVKAFGKDVAANPTTYFTKEFLEKFDAEIIGPMFKYGSAGPALPGGDEGEDNEG